MRRVGIELRYRRESFACEASEASVQRGQLQVSLLLIGPTLPTQAKQSGSDVVQTGTPKLIVNSLPAMHAGAEQHHTQGHSRI